MSVALLGLGGYWGLKLAPPERYMGDVYRIMYVHVPSAWTGLIAFTVSFVASVVYLFKSSRRTDAIASQRGDRPFIYRHVAYYRGDLG
ncbi:MAG: hypothetical protein R3C68_11360 [Myxococcota bacterium]